MNPANKPLFLPQKNSILHGTRMCSRNEHARLFHF